MGKVVNLLMIKLIHQYHMLALLLEII